MDEKIGHKLLNYMNEAKDRIDTVPAYVSQITDERRKRESGIDLVEEHIEKLKEENEKYRETLSTIRKSKNLMHCKKLAKQVMESFDK